MKPRVLAALLLVLSASALFASADLVVSVTDPRLVIPPGVSHTELTVAVYDLGPDAAKDVKISVVASSGIAVDCAACDIGDLPANISVSRKVTFTPATTGPLTITTTVTSSTPDSNTANNTATHTFTVSNDPDLLVSLFYPVYQDLGAPFTLDVYLANTALVPAHAVEVTVDFLPSVGVRTLPGGCTNPMAGRVVCHADTFPADQFATLVFSMELVAPTDYGSGKIAFTATATEAEHDFNPTDNTVTRETTLYKTFYVTTTANDGAGSLRQAILDANAGCRGVPCAIGFKITESSSTPWKTIRVDTPLPPLTTTVHIDGAIQSALVAPANTNGPDVEITGSASAGDGLTVAVCGVEIANLAINGFPNNGVSVSWETCDSGAESRLHDLFVGTDPTGTAARPNLRGIGLTAHSGTLFTSGPQGIGADTYIYSCVISGNQRSGVFDLGGRVSLTSNRIGVKAHSDEPLPNGNAGVYIGPGGNGSDVGASFFGADQTSFSRFENVIAFNGQMGVAVASTVSYVAIRHNRIWGNGGLGIDIGLDGQKASTPPPVITLAHYDPATKQTVIEGDTIRTNDTFLPHVDLFASDAPDPSGFGEGQRPLGNADVNGTTNHFRLAVDGDLTGQFITGTTTHVLFVGFAKPADPNGVDQGFLSTTTEFSRAVEVR